MPRIALNAQQRREHKVISLKGWVVAQMKLTGKHQADVADVLGLSVGRVSQMLKIPKGKGDKTNPDPFSYGQVLTLCEYFGVDEDERRKLLTM